jgi:DNA-binding Lrp family transcriptional regulator
MPSDRTVDSTDAQLLLAMSDDPRATSLALAARLGLSRNTVQARLSRWDRAGLLRPFSRRVDPATLGYPLTAFVMARVTQRLLDSVAAALSDIPEVIEVLGISGAVDLLVQVVATDDEDLYETAGRILSIEGIERTETSLVMRRLVDHRVEPLLKRLSATTSSPRPRRG